MNAFKTSPILTTDLLGTLGLTRNIREFTATELAAREKLLFGVEMIPVKDALEVYSTSSKTHVILAAADDITPGAKKLVNVVSAGYGLTHISEIINPLEDLLKEKFNVVPKYKVVDHCKFFIDYIIEKPVHMGDDILKPRIRIQHSYSGDLTYNMSFGFWRQVCSNGMHAHQYDSVMKRKHTIRNAARISNDTICQVEEFVNLAADYVEEYKLLQHREVVDLPNRIQEVIEATDFPKTYAEAVEKRVRYESRELGQPVNDWLIYNGFNFQLNHNDEMKMQLENRSKVDKEILEYLYV